MGEVFQIPLDPIGAAIRYGTQKALVLAKKMVPAACDPSRGPEVRTSEGTLLQFTPDSVSSGLHVKVAGATYVENLRALLEENRIFADVSVTPRGTIVITPQRVSDRNEILRLQKALSNPLLAEFNRVAFEGRDSETLAVASRIKPTELPAVMRSHVTYRIWEARMRLMRSTYQTYFEQAGKDPKALEKARMAAWDLAQGYAALGTMDAPGQKGPDTWDKHQADDYMYFYTHAIERHDTEALRERILEGGEAVNKWLDSVAQESPSRALLIIQAFRRNTAQPPGQYYYVNLAIDKHQLNLVLNHMMTLEARLMGPPKK